MSLLVRKINKAKWYKIDIENHSDVVADAITNCLKTTRNTLSVWHINDKEDLDEAVLAIVSNQDHIESIDVVILSETSLIETGIKIVTSPGNTPFQGFVDSHRDISELTYSSLGLIKDHIVERIRDENIVRYTKSKLTKLLLKAIEEGVLKRENLNDSLKSKLA